ncbi:hypothetical protein EJP82_26720 [Paenibacillus anaericanus]|uniref:Uncharacterized protein n=1 Tax=Paenibacillus anaericanus TaxID=170367 RepID=A0A3S1DDJ0_9BACL|nr:hypothetical protein [Paenibacillus anaericanus]RUT38709.1 hypothetical protein EJP82_26720 [Paenibacillus anaericanus]
MMDYFYNRNLSRGYKRIYWVLVIAAAVLIFTPILLNNYGSVHLGVVVAIGAGMFTGLVITIINLFLTMLHYRRN